ncbi:MAG: TIGR02147 family protein [Bdellovibrionales bacterium]|nr:TIGR02147 family protein [Bdellovibrionales bacterium]
MFIQKLFPPPQASEPGTDSIADFRIYLQHEFLKRCRKNERYSLSAFAKALGMDKSTLAKVMKGQRPLRKQLIQKLGLKIGLSPNQIAQFEKASPRKNARLKAGPVDSTDIQYQQLTLDAFQVISDWYHYAIMELCRLPDFDPNPSKVARILGITSTEVQIAIERLVRLEMLEVLQDGSWRDLTGGYSTTLSNPFTASAFRNMQRQLLEKALLAIEEVPFHKRSQTSTTMAVDSKKIPEVKKVIADFQKKMNQILNVESASSLDSVYALTVSLFPLTQGVLDETPKTR